MTAPHPVERPKPPMTVVALTPVWNKDDPTLGFIVSWMEALAARVDRVVIVVLERQATPAPSNAIIHSLGKERGRGRAASLVAWHRTWRRILRETPPDLVFAHMIPMFAVLASPYVRARHTPLVLWYTHRQVSPMLKWAHRVATRILTASPDSYRHAQTKVTAVGHGIDCRLFSPADRHSPASDHILVVARLSPIKDPGTFVRAMAIVREQGWDGHARWIGHPPRRDAEFARDIEALPAQLGHPSLVQFTGGLRQDELPAAYRASAVHVNLSPPGLFDKAALESMACGVPTLVANDAFAPVLGRWADRLLFRHGDAEHLAGQLMQLLSLPLDVRREIGAELRRAVVEQHGLDRLWDHIVDIFAADVAAARRERRSNGP